MANQASDDLLRTHIHDLLIRQNDSRAFLHSHRDDHPVIKLLIELHLLRRRRGELWMQYCEPAEEEKDATLMQDIENVGTRMTTIRELLLAFYFEHDPIMWKLRH